MRESFIALIPARRDRNHSCAKLIVGTDSHACACERGFSHEQFAYGLWLMANGLCLLFIGMRPSRCRNGLATLRTLAADVAGKHVAAGHTDRDSLIAEAFPQRPLNLRAPQD